KEAADNAPGRVSRAAAKFFETLLGAYRASLAWALRWPLVVVVILFATIGLNFFLYGHIAKGFFPQQDTGRLIGFIRADQGLAFQAMQAKLNRFVDIVRADPAIENVTAYTGGGQRNRGGM